MLLDDLDHKIIALLRADPQVANKTIAGEVNVAEATVATRIRSMTERNLIRIAAQRDIHALGDHVIAHIDVFLEGREVDAVAAELAEIAEIASVAILMGSPQIIAQVHARDGTALLKTLETKVSKIRGIERVESSISLEVLKYRSDLINLADAT